jgi:hypothetical protein
MKADIINQLWAAITNGPTLYKAAFFAALGITAAAIMTVICIVVLWWRDVRIDRRRRRRRHETDVSGHTSRHTRSSA